jgi:hypothetical protein
MSNEVKNIRVLEDIEEAICREVRRTRTETIFKELFNPLTGEMVRKPIEAQFFDDSASPGQIVSPRFNVALLKLYEDTKSHRLLPAIGNEDIEMIDSPQAYEVILGGDEAAISTDTENSLVVNNTKIRRISSDFMIRIVSGNNIGTYKIESITLIDNGPHLITLSNELLSDLPIFSYNKIAGIITFNGFVDLSAVKTGDIFADKLGTEFDILAVDTQSFTIAIAKGSNVVNGIGASVTRVSPVLQNAETELISYLVFDPTKPLNKASKYRARSWPIPYTFLYYIKVVSNERDDHLAVANRMMQVMNPPRGTILTIVRSDKSSESTAIKDVESGSTTIFVDDATYFYVNDRIQLFSDISVGEELIIMSVNNASNSIMVTTPVTQAYLYNDHAKIVSNCEVKAFERDFLNHMTEDVPEKQFWVHRFTYRIEGWVDSRIPPIETEQTFMEIGDVNFISGTLEGIDDVV